MNELRNALDTVLAHAAQIREAQATHAAYERLDRFMASSEPDLRAFTRDALPELERLLRDSREAAAQFEALSRSLKDNPSQLIYQPAAGGVEIPR